MSTKFKSIKFVADQTDESDGSIKTLAIEFNSQLLCKMFDYKSESEVPLTKIRVKCKRINGMRFRGQTSVEYTVGKGKYKTALWILYRFLLKGHGLTDQSCFWLTLGDRDDARRFFGETLIKDTRSLDTEHQLLRRILYGTNVNVSFEIKSNDGEKHVA